MWHTLDDDDISVTDPIVLQRLLVVRQQLAIVSYSYLGRWDSGLDFAEGLEGGEYIKCGQSNPNQIEPYLEIFQLQIGRHIEDENQVARRGHGNLHGSPVGGWIDNESLCVI